MSSGKWRPFCLGLNVLNVASKPREHYFTVLLVIDACKPISLLTYTWSETYFREDLFPAYLFFRRQFHTIVIFLFQIDFWPRLCIFRHEFYKNGSKSQFHENTDENLTYVSFVCRLTTSPL